MAHGLIGLGSNQGDRGGALRAALWALRAVQGVKIDALSGFSRTSPVGGPPDQAPYLNGAATLQTVLAPHRLLDHMQEIEERLGRRRGPQWGERPIDLDLLLYDDTVIETSDLCVPHRRMGFRRFVIEPAATVASDWRHPTIGWTIGELRSHLRDAVPYVAICGVCREKTTELAKRLHASIGGQLLLDPVGGSPESLRDLQRSVEGQSSEIQLIERRAQLLDRDSWNESTKPAISDFWFGESLAAASALRSDEARERVEERWRRFESRVMRPKLTVLLDTAPDRMAEKDSKRERDHPPTEPAELHWALRDAMERSELGPTMIVNAAEWDSAFHEITAAVEAMQ